MVTFSVYVAEQQYLTILPSYTELKIRKMISPSEGFNQTVFEFQKTDSGIKCQRLPKLLTNGLIIQ